MRSKENRTPDLFEAMYPDEIHRCSTSMGRGQAAHQIEEIGSARTLSFKSNARGPV